MITSDVRRLKEAKLGVDYLLPGEARDSLPIAC